MANFRLQIVSQTRVLFDEDVMSIVVPGKAGYFGVLANHAPMLAALGKGDLKVIHAPLHESVFRIAGGFFEVRDNKAIVLPDHIEGLGVESTE